MKAFFLTLVLIYSLAFLSKGQNRIVFKTGNYIEGKIISFLGDNLTISVKKQSGGVESQSIRAEYVTEIFGPCSKSRKISIQKKFPDIDFIETLPSNDLISNNVSANTYPYFNQIETLPNLIPLTEVKQYYQDGKTFQYYHTNGVIITMNLFSEKKYGKYYVAFIAIDNLTGEEFNFHPEDINTILMVEGGSKNGKVFSSDEYLKKVDRRQAWNAALVAFGEASAANNAGYSRTTTKTNVTGNVSVNSNNSWNNMNNNHESIQGTSNATGNLNVRTTSNSYNGAENFAAKQIARNNVDTYRNQQHQVRETINQGYLKLNTIFDGQSIIGHINIEFEDAGHIVIVVPVNGANFCFTWDTENL